jgi:hypothetical protein
VAKKPPKKQEKKKKEKSINQKPKKRGKSVSHGSTERILTFPSALFRLSNSDSPAANH